VNIFSDMEIEISRVLNLFYVQVNPYRLFPGNTGEWTKGGQPQKPEETVFKMMEKTEEGKEMVHQREV
jgi:hypothetical protein